MISSGSVWARAEAGACAATAATTASTATNVRDPDMLTPRDQSSVQRYRHVEHGREPGGAMRSSRDVTNRHGRTRSRVARRLRPGENRDGPAGGCRERRLRPSRGAANGYPTLRHEYSPCPVASRRRVQPAARRQRPSVGVGEPDAGRTLQPGRDRRRHGRARDRRGRRRHRCEGGADRAAPDGRRLPERRLRTVEGDHPRGARVGVRTRRGRVRPNVPGRCRARLRGRDGPHAPAPRGDQPHRFGRTVQGARRGRLHRRGPLHGPRHLTGGRRHAALRAGRGLHRGARHRPADSRPRQGGLPDQRNGLLADRAAAAPRRHRRRSDRLRAGPGVRPLRQ